MLRDWIGIIGTLLGVILGFFLNQLIPSKIQERKQRRSVRALLSLEIDQNLDLLRELWNKANQVKESDQNPNLSKARRLVEMSLPLWSHKAWESQIPLLAIALSEKEIKQVHPTFRTS